MQLLFWILFGALVGIIVNVKNPNPNSVLGTILLGIWGAVLGGFLAEVFFSEGVLGSIFSLIIALAGSALILVTQRAILKKVT